MLFVGEVEVQINVESRAVVQNLSEDSRFAMDSQYKNLTLEKGTTIINVSVYTREVFVRVSAQFFSNWNPELQFYNIPQIGTVFNLLLLKMWSSVYSINTIQQKWKNEKVKNVQFHHQSPMPV